VKIRELEDKIYGTIGTSRQRRRYTDLANKIVDEEGDVNPAIEIMLQILQEVLNEPKPKMYLWQPNRKTRKEGLGE
jgi:hypothetical protein